MPCCSGCPITRDLLPALIGKLASGGALAVQMPDNLDEPAHRLMREVAAAGPWAAKLAAAAAARAALAGAAWYYELLRPLCAKVDLWRTTYYHSLRGRRRRGRGVVQGQRSFAVS